MKKLFQGEHNITHHAVNHYGKEHLEKEFIIQFFESLPVESLKDLVKFKEIDPKNKLIWDNVDRDPELINLLYILRDRQKVMYRCELLLEV